MIASVCRISADLQFHVPKGASLRGNVLPVGSIKENGNAFDSLGSILIRTPLHAEVLGILRCGNHVPAIGRAIKDVSFSRVARTWHLEKPDETHCIVDAFLDRVVPGHRQR